MSDPIKPPEPVTEAVLTLNGLAPSFVEEGAQQQPGYFRAVMKPMQIPGPMRVVSSQTTHLRNENARLMAGVFPPTTTTTNEQEKK